MKKRMLFSISIILILVSLALAIPALANQHELITFVNISNGDTVNLSVGETVDFQVVVDSPNATFVQALLLSDQYYPGRGIFMGGADIATQATSADLSVSATGKNSTANLAAADSCEAGQAPVGLVAAVRYVGGVVETKRIDFCIAVDVE